MSSTKGRWIMSDDLQVGDTYIDGDGTVFITKITLVPIEEYEAAGSPELETNRKIWVWRE